MPGSSLPTDALVTRSANHSILSGITRASVLRMARKHRHHVSRSVRSLSRKPRPRARHSSPAPRSWVKPVVQIDDRSGRRRYRRAAHRAAAALWLSATTPRNGGACDDFSHVSWTASPPTRPRAVLFDWDNTLIDSWGCHPCMRKTTTLVAFGLPPWTLEETRTRVRRIDARQFPALFGARWPKRGISSTPFRPPAHADACSRCRERRRCCEALSESGIYLRCRQQQEPGDYLRAEAGALGWDALFRQARRCFRCAARQACGRSGPHGACDGAGLRAGPDVWFAGDADIDLQCAAMRADAFRCCCGDEARTISGIFAPARAGSSTCDDAFGAWSQRAPRPPYDAGVIRQKDRTWPS